MKARSAKKQAREADANSALAKATAEDVHRRSKAPVKTCPCRKSNANILVV
jgi:hypothetical protein